MSYTSRPEDLQLIDYAGVLRRRWWLILVITVAGTLAGAGYLQAAHKVYTATASVYVTATSGTTNQVANGRTTGAVNLDTQAQVVQSSAVAQAAAKLMHATDTVPQLLGRVSVAVPANSQVLAISCQASTPDKAASCAQSFAQAYLSYSSAATTASVNSQISVLQSKINGLQSASAKLTVAAANLPLNSSQRATAEEQLKSDHSQLSSLNSQVAQLTAALANPSGGSIISNALPPSKPSSPKPLLIVPSGLLAGLLIGLVLAFLTDRRQRRIRRPQDVTRADVPVLMSLPARGPAPELTLAAPRSPLGREFSELAHVLTGAMGVGRHVILVSGIIRGQGASLVAANLAAALSRNQPDVTMVCADLEGSVIPDMVGLPSEPGLTDVLAGGELADDAGRRLATAPRLRVIPPGSDAGLDAEDIRQDAMERMLDDLRTDSRWVVLEGPAVTSRPDVSTLAHLADAAVLVAEVPRTRSDQLLDGVEHLGKMGAPVLGVALLPAPRGSGPPLRMASRQASLAADAAPQERRAIPAVSPDDVPVNGDRPAPGHVVADDAPTAPFRN
jgi:capsular polysaccharide biosynthesis protein/MinD-like ATPase involved in chromosome partitioning or flagellar assembly